MESDTDKDRPFTCSHHFPESRGGEETHPSAILFVMMDVEAFVKRRPKSALALA